MKIAYLLNSITKLGGTERVVIFKASALADHGHDVTLLVTSDDQFGNFKYELSPKLKVVYWHLNNPDLGYVECLKKLKLHFKLIRNYIKTEHPDFLISVGYVDRLYLPFMHRGDTMIICELHMVPNFREIDMKGSKMRILHTLKYFIEYRMLSGRWDKNVLLTEYDYTHTWKGNRKNTTWIHDPLTIRPIVSDLSSKTIVSMGRLESAKNMALLIHAFALVHQKHSDWNLKIFGDGTRKEELQSLNNDLGLNDCVKLNSPTQDVAKELSQASIFALSPQYEAFDMVFIEALACGLPVVTTETTGAIEIFKNYGCGFLTKCGDEIEMANRICQLIEDPKLMRQMQQRALERAKDFDAETIIAKWEKLFSEMKVVNDK